MEIFDLHEKDEHYSSEQSEIRNGFRSELYAKEALGNVLHEEMMENSALKSALMDQSAKDLLEINK